jgi:hypothetical protein
MQAQLLMIVHHRNLVSLIGYCDEGEKKALIYEYMGNGNVQQHLLGNYGLSALVSLFFFVPVIGSPLKNILFGSSILFLLTCQET